MGSESRACGEVTAIYTLQPSLTSGMYEKLSLLAQPAPSVSWGENVTLQCRSEIWMDTFHLSKEGSPAPPQHLVLQDTAAPFQANFSFGPVTSDHEGTYRCYGSDSTFSYLLSLPSDPLELRVSGIYRKPSLSALPSPVVTLGGNITLQCGSWLGSDSGKYWAVFPVDPVIPFHRWMFTCYGCNRNIPQEWSHPSDPLGIGLTVASGEKVTLLCQSWSPRESFLLSKEGAADSP
uniref:Immunoglobulin-like beta-sandwich domain-containing protein n=1 Tax=Equus caballus TaxID=9796 RepID=A0A3Q2H8H4_HORSE